MKSVIRLLFVYFIYNMLCSVLFWKYGSTNTQHYMAYKVHHIKCVLSCLRKHFSNKQKKLSLNTLLLLKKEISSNIYAIIIIHHIIRYMAYLYFFSMSTACLLYLMTLNENICSILMIIIVHRYITIYIVCLWCDSWNRCSYDIVFNFLFALLWKQMLLLLK